MTTSWSESAGDLALGRREVHLWRLDLDDQITPTLSEAESERVARFRSPAHRRRWTSARSFLRLLLGAYVDVDPMEIEFALGENDKPELVRSHRRRIQFNVSHSGGMAIYGLAQRPIGVDIEELRSDIEMIAVARLALGDDVAHALASLPLVERIPEFFRQWVRHEASVKCSGKGLNDEPGSRPTAHLSLTDVDMGSRHAAALALDVEDSGAQWDWSGLRLWEARALLG